MSILLSGCGWVDDGVDGNEPPSALQADYQVTVGERLPVSADDGLLSNASDRGGRPLTARLVPGSGPRHAASFHIEESDGSFVYEHDGGDSTEDSFSFVVNDGIDDSEPTEVSIHIHQYPTVMGQEYEAVPGRALNIKAPGVLQGAEDLNGDQLRARLEDSQEAQKGELTLNEDGSFTYLAPITANGDDSFGFYAHDGTLDSEPATVAIALRHIARPSAGEDHYQIEAGETLGVEPPGILGNDSSPNGGTLTAQLSRAPAHAARFELQENGAFVYEHNGDNAIADEFTYRAADLLLSEPTTVSIAINQPPIANNDAYTAALGTVLQVSAGAGVLANDTDPNPEDQGDLRAELVDPPTMGTLNLAEDGSFTYAPNGSATGTDSFRYRARDASVSSEAATVLIEIQREPPNAQADAYSVNEGDTLNIPAPGVLGNDSGPAGVSLQAQLSAAPAFAAVFELRADGSFTYTPDGSAATEDSFRYYAFYEDGDETYDSDPVQVSITIARENEAPVAQGGCVDTRHGETLRVSLTASDRETAPEELIYEVPSQSEGGALIWQDEGWNGTAYEVVYQSTSDSPWGRHIIPYTVTDTAGASDSADIQVVLRPRIMPLGDSITRGVGDERPAPAGYRDRLWHLIAEDGYRVDFVGSQNSGTESMDTHHEGHNGIQSDGISSQVYSWLDGNPADLVLLHIGTNDLNTGSTSSQTDAGIGEILAQIGAWADSNSPVEILVAQIIDFLPSEPRVAELNSLIAERVPDGRRVDQYSALHHGSQPNSALYYDRLHPNQDGYAVMAETWYQKLDPRLSQARCSPES